MFLATISCERIFCITLPFVVSHAILDIAENVTNVVRDQMLVRE